MNTGEGEGQWHSAISNTKSNRSRRRAMAAADSNEQEECVQDARCGIREGWVGWWYCLVWSG